MPRPVRFIVAYLLLVAGVFPPGAAVPVAAQNTGVVEGVVVDVTTERPMVGAQIEVMDLEPGVSTDADGRFRIPMVPAGETFIKASASGYAIVVERIQVEAGEHARVEIRLGPLAGSTVREMAASPPPTAAIDVMRGESLGRIGPREIEARGGSDLESVLSGQVAGAAVRASGGQAGSGLEILIRGVNTLTQSNEPVIYLDGIRLTPSRSRSLITSIRSRGALDFIDPGTIERVEILKGPAASVRYGPDASAGVVLIYTKH